MTPGLENGDTLKLNIADIMTSPDLSQSDEIVEARDWFMERVQSLPSMTVERVPATDGTGWLGKLSPEGQVESIESARGFF